MDLIRTTIRFTPEVFERLLSLCKGGGRLKNSSAQGEYREFNIKLPADLHEDITLLAKEWDRSFNYVVLELVNRSRARARCDVQFTKRVIGILKDQVIHVRSS